jgi:hypothetical protein
LRKWYAQVFIILTSPKTKFIADPEDEGNVMVRMEMMLHKEKNHG